MQNYIASTGVGVLDGCPFCHRIRLHGGVWNLASSSANTPSFVVLPGTYRGLRMKQATRRWDSVQICGNSDVFPLL
ncbi:hypothetical protein IF1G_09646 [Cordyceps javanica]|uniref:Uncharacterized protein n=1 Tax=Cordyceps javanica TaxID=43265 RepID=A0A545UQ46_9HYPO|nr:hypothetical protein IF1G_09646 [Cordyceps javanica]